MSTFEQFNLPKSLQKALDDLGLTTPTPIQEKSFSSIMSGRDVMGIAQTGTGKTLAYLLPLLKQWKFVPTDSARVVIIVPTRELVVQIVEVIESLTQYMSVRTLGIYSLTTQDTGVDIGNNDSYLITKLGGTGYFQLGGGGTTSQPSSTGQGLYIGVFTGTPTVTLYKNGSFVSSNNVGSTSFGTRNLLLSANNNSGGVDNYCPRTHGFAFFATSLTSSEVSTLSTIINTWATTIGRNTY